MLTSTSTRHFVPRRDRVARATLLAVITAVSATVYACSDGTGPGIRPVSPRQNFGAEASVVAPGVVTICKVGPGASFGIQVGLGTSFQPATITEGNCLTLPTITAAPGDDVIVTVRENTQPWYALDRIVFDQGEGEQTITSGNSVSFEGTHGANVTFFNDGVVRLCKVGTDATFQYEVGLGAGFNPLSLTNGECSTIARIPPGAPGDDVVVTVRENASPSYALNHITLAYGGGQPSIVGGGSSQVGFEGMHGGTVVFYNDPADGGCTYTLGWYKNKGSESLPAGNFALSGAAWLAVLETSPRGNAYYILAHQYIVALLNSQSASTPPAVASALANAAGYFGVATPANWSAGGVYDKDQLTAWTNTLTAYNEGTIGPGHCD